MEIEFKQRMVTIDQIMKHIESGAIRFVSKGSDTKLKLYRLQGEISDRIGTEPFELWAIAPNIQEGLAYLLDGARYQADAIRNIREYPIVRGMLPGL